MKSRLFFLFSFFYTITAGYAQHTGEVIGIVRDGSTPVPFASVALLGTFYGSSADSLGRFRIESVPHGAHTLVISAIGYKPFRQQVAVRSGKSEILAVQLVAESGQLDEVVVTGTMKEVSKLASPVPVDLIPQKFLLKNPVPSIFESLSYVNGVRPQVNCNVCNTGDIHINGLEGPYTMVMIDGMPIVSGLSTVYGLNGIPVSLIERVEIVKGPASSLYGSEAVGGLINIITKSVDRAPVLAADVFSSNWLDLSVDLSTKFKVADRISSLIGVNYFNYKNPVDKNGDGFTDLTLQNRISLFNKWSFSRRDNRQANIAFRYLYEDRWGGQMNWSAANRGGDEVYGESIYTKRLEVLGSYQLPIKEKVTLQYSLNSHNQNSYYGVTSYMATQRIVFAQVVWDKTIRNHSVLAGLPFRYTYYNDNTPATSGADGRDKADHIYLPGIFVQDEIALGRHSLLFGGRYDYNSRHGNILTPRVAYKLTLNKTDAVRLNLGSGYRVVNLFTEDHAALTGARDVVIREELKPEQSWNANLNFVKKIVIANSFIGVDASVFYTRFSNRIVPDYDTNPQQIIYDNLEGHAVSKGISLNLDVNLYMPLKVNLGATVMDNRVFENGSSFRPVLTERVMGTWAATYSLDRIGVSVDYTGNLIGPMRLPVMGENDPRSAYSPYWSLQNMQFTKRLRKGWEVYAGVKNLLNFRPPANAIARAHDPFNKQVSYDGEGNVVATPENLHAMTFDPSYVFAPNQGIRGFAGVRLIIQ
jgi:outer membrane receptor for ferrienterochelin and colicins